jgi:hypothetical protein
LAPHAGLQKGGASVEARCGTRSMCGGYGFGAAGGEGGVPVAAERTDSPISFIEA